MAKDAKKPKDAPATEPVEATDAAAKEARKAEKAATKAAKEAAKAAEREAKAGKKADKKADKKKTKDAAEPRFKHVRKKKLSSGKGPTPQEIGESLVALFNAGKAEEAESTWYHRKIDSIEEDGTVFEGWKGVQEKGKWWRENFTVISLKAAGPYVCSTGFAVVYSGRLRMPDGNEVNAHECGVYTVEDGRIVREQFMKAAF
ncbi:MAG: SnoaL-like domain-containing protein [bacterium]